MHRTNRIFAFLLAVWLMAAALPFSAIAERETEVLPAEQTETAALAEQATEDSIIQPETNPKQEVLPEIPVEAGKPAEVYALPVPPKAKDLATSGNYEYSVTDGKATITSYTGAGAAVTIPSTLGGYPVNSIGYCAFYECYGLTEITIPDSVTSIGRSAFYGCKGLTVITVAEENSVYHSAGNCLIETESKTLIAGCKTSVIPADGSVTSIGEDAFSYCTGLTEITIPGSVTSIGNYAFFRCTGLTDITIPDSVTSIGYCAFRDCSGLTSVTIPDSVTSIGDYAFSLCTGLRSITVAAGNTTYHSAGNCLIETESKTLIAGCKTSVIPADGSVTSIGRSAFCGYIGLTEITIPDSVTTIGDHAFEGCKGLTSVTVAAGNPAYHSAGNCLIETESKTLIAGCKASVIPADGSVTSIGDWAFYDCTGLTEITIPDSVTSIGGSAFSYCTGLTEITIPGSVTSIGYDAFEYCTGLTSVTIGNGVTSIGWYAFSGCTGLTEITIPDSVTSIGDWAFYDCTGLTEITIPDSVTSIGDWVFCGCTGLTDITIPDSVTSIGYEAFWGCTGLTEITIPDSVTSIGYYAFSYCTGLTEITIPDSVTSIGSLTFYGCSGLTTVYYSGTEELWNAIPIESGNEPLQRATKVFATVLDNIGVTVSGLVEPGTVLMATEQALSEDQKSLFSYYDIIKSLEIKLMKGEVPTQPLMEVTVSLPLPEGANGEKTRVLHLTEEGKICDMNARVEDGFLVFTTDHFSLFVIAERKYTPGDANDDGRIDTADIVRLKNYLAGVPGVEICPGADANGDGKVDTSDITRLKNYLANLDYETGVSTVLLGK